MEVIVKLEPVLETISTLDLSFDWVIQWIRNTLVHKIKNRDSSAHSGHFPRPLILDIKVHAMPISHETEMNNDIVPIKTKCSWNTISLLGFTTKKPDQIVVCCMGANLPYGDFLVF